MESRSYMFSTAKKRSTLLESKGLEYCICYVDSRRRMQIPPVCVSPKRNAPINSTVSQIACKRTQLTLMYASISEKNYSSAESLDLERPTQIPTTIIDINKKNMDHSIQKIIIHYNHFFIRKLLFTCRITPFTPSPMYKLFVPTESDLLC